jgi:hypothetical protein
MLTYAGVCRYSGVVHLVTAADVCRRMQTHADVC